MLRPLRLAAIRVTALIPIGESPRNLKSYPQKERENDPHFTFQPMEWQLWKVPALRSSTQALGVTIPL
jgi:hypothetical protein